MTGRCNDNTQLVGRLGVLTAGSPKILVFCDFTQCQWVNNSQRSECIANPLKPLSNCLQSDTVQRNIPDDLNICYIHFLCHVKGNVSLCVTTMFLHGG